MLRIRILPESLANRIAAGEIIERPASVVKELVENSLDAGAQRIEVEISGGGQKLIRVSDDGTGMDRENIVLCLERHATSKLTDESDLFRISTLGFRGEALPSIASVSRLNIISRKKGENSGSRISVKFGKVIEIKEIGCAEGTTIEVEDLFGNVPARRKFLKSVQTETAQIEDCLEQLSLSNLNVKFIFKADGRAKFISSPGEDLSVRLTSILKMDKKEELLRVEEIEGELSVSGLVGAPLLSQFSLRSFFTYVNGRFVKDKVVYHAVIEAYEGFLMKGRYPVGVLYINLPPSEVDVNVHPAKREIRFQTPSAIHKAVYKGIRRLLLFREGPVRFSPVEKTEHSVNAIGQSSEEPFVAMPFLNQVLKEEGVPYITRGKASGAFESSTTSSLPWELKLLGQLGGTYILCQSPGGMLVVDQHAAHERIIFEKLASDLEKGEMERQQLLFPLTLEFTRSEAAILSGHFESLKGLGIELTPFGGTTFMARSIPAFISEKDFAGMIGSILSRIAASDSFPGGAFLNEILALMACHAAIRANQILTLEEMECLLQQLAACENSSSCPHGRPIWRLYRYDEIERDFKRK